MTVEKRPESEARELSEAANDWFQQFLKLLEVFMIDAGRQLPSDADATACRLAAARAVKLTLLDSGIDNEEMLALFGQVAIEDALAPGKAEWNAELNKRRLALIDRDIQGTLIPAEQVELAGLTQMMRRHVDSEANLPLEGARRLHRLLSELDSDSAGTES